MVIMLKLLSEDLSLTILVALSVCFSSVVFAKMPIPQFTPPYLVDGGFVVMDTKQDLLIKYDSSGGVLWSTSVHQNAQLVGVHRGELVVCFSDRVNRSIFLDDEKHDENIIDLFLYNSDTGAEQTNIVVRGTLVGLLDSGICVRSNEMLRCLDVDTGSQIWQKALPGFHGSKIYSMSVEEVLAISAFSRADNGLFVVQCLDVGDGRILFTYSHSGTAELPLLEIPNVAIDASDHNFALLVDSSIFVFSESCITAYRRYLGGKFVRLTSGSELAVMSRHDDGAWRVEILQGSELRKEKEYKVPFSVQPGTTGGKRFIWWERSVVEIATGMIRGQLRSDFSYISGVVFLPESGQFIGTGYNVQENGWVIFLFDISTGKVTVCSRLNGGGVITSRHSSIEFQEPSGVENGTAAGSK